jgi:hypothetical protein
LVALTCFDLSRILLLKASRSSFVASSYTNRLLNADWHELRNGLSLKPDRVPTIRQLPLLRHNLPGSFQLPFEQSHVFPARFRIWQHLHGIRIFGKSKGELPLSEAGVSKNGLGDCAGSAISVTSFFVSFNGGAQEP